LIGPPAPDDSQMPIHDQSYRRYAGPRDEPGHAWTVIAWAGIRSMITKRMFIGLLIFAWIPFIVRAVQTYIAANFPQASMLQPTVETYREFIDQQGAFGTFGDQQNTQTHHLSRRIATAVPKTSVRGNRLAIKGLERYRRSAAGLPTGSSGTPWESCWAWCCMADCIG